MTKPGAMDLSSFLDRLRYIISIGYQGPCRAKFVPEMLTRKNPLLGNRSMIDVLWKDGDEGWKLVEKLLDDSVCAYQDDRGDVPPIWAGEVEPIIEEPPAEKTEAEIELERRIESAGATYGPDTSDADLEAALASEWVASSESDCRVGIARWGSVAREARRRGWTFASGKRTAS